MFQTFAHIIPVELERMPVGEAIYFYLGLGFKHIIPFGFDHILFILSLFLLSPKLKTVLIQATAFTVAHSVTLGLAMYGLINPPAIVEPLIALSIVFVALENVFSQRMKASRIGIIFLFGLVHGMGFASSLGDLGLPRNSFVTSLVMFNLGVEIGQMAIIFSAWLLISRNFGKKYYYRKAIVIPLSLAIAAIAGFWTIERFMGDRIVVDRIAVEKIINNYGQPQSLLQNENEVSFWKNRIDPKSPGLVNEMRYAMSLSSRFRFSGNIADLIFTDSLLTATDSVFSHREAGPAMAMVGLYIMRHQFMKADSVLTAARKLNPKKYDQYALSFDVSYELGNYELAESHLKQIADKNDFGYNFRLAKMLHYKGKTKEAVDAMLHAADLARSNDGLKRLCLANAGDLYMHSGMYKPAYKLYLQCLKLDESDLHSLSQIGCIAYLQDKDFELAEQVFRFIQTKTKSPEPLLKLAYVAEARGDSILYKKYALLFAAEVTKPVYGKMYSKYLIELYTGVLNQPEKAVMLAREELDNRANPQTYAWYSWALFSSGNKSESLMVYEKFVAGKPLEEYEIRLMRKM